MADRIVVLSPEELRELVRDAVRTELEARGHATTAPGPLLSKQQLAAQLGISVAGVDRLVGVGKIPFVRVGDVKRFDLAAVRAALEVLEAQEIPRQPYDGPVRLLARGRR